MSEKNDGGPAFPEVFTKFDDGNWQQPGVVTSTSGMTLRDYFAAAALPQAMVVASRSFENSSQQRNCAARLSYLQADAMIEEREA
jgi:hypothetical protein